MVASIIKNNGNKRVWIFFLSGWVQDNQEKLAYLESIGTKIDSFEGVIGIGAGIYLYDLSRK